MDSVEETICDALVIGSGAGGMAAAITARLAGLDVLLIEKNARFGGTTALSGGWVWIPLSPQASSAGVIDSASDVIRYLRQEAGAHFNQALVEAFIANGPQMLRLFEEKTSVRLQVSLEFPDYHPDVPGGTAGGRALSPLPLDARELGTNLAKLARPLRELSLAGMVIGSGTELKHFFNATRSLRSAIFVAKKLTMHAWDVLRFGRGMTLVNGNALAGRLGKTLFDLGIPLWLDCPAVELIGSGARIDGAWVVKKARRHRITARRGVVLACGGFPHDVARRVARYAHPAGSESHFPVAPAGNTGDGLRMAEAVGGVANDTLADSAAWTPVSRVRWPDGNDGIYPHFVDRAKPGIIAVTRGGRRFVNESDSYHDFVKGFIREHAREPGPEIFFVCDHRAISRYGLGIVKPFPFPKGFWLRSGYLMRAPTIAALAARAGIDPDALGSTIADFNTEAMDGRDPAFGRGRTAYNRFQGDPQHQPNACLAPLSEAPFYAVRIWPGDIGTFAGLITDAKARVMDRAGRALTGLYAVGNDMASVMGGTYPGPGITLGPALVFGYIAGTHLAQLAKTCPDDATGTPANDRATGVGA